MDPGQGSSHSKESLLYGTEPKVVDMITSELKSQGLFDQFRRECHADVDTKPAYQNLKQQVEASLEEKLDQLDWQPDTVKNHVREDLRSQIELDLRDPNLDGMLNQAIRPKVFTEFIPQISDLVYSTLGLEKPATSKDDHPNPTPNEMVGDEKKGDQDQERDQLPIYPDSYYEYDAGYPWDDPCYYENLPDYESVEESNPSLSSQPVLEPNVGPDTGSTEELCKEATVCPDPEKTEALVQKVGETKTEVALLSESVQAEGTVDLLSQSTKENPATCSGAKKPTESKKSDLKTHQPKPHKQDKKPEEKKKHSTSDKRQSSSEKSHSRNKSSLDTKPPKSTSAEAHSSQSKSKNESSTKNAKHTSRSKHHKDELSKKRGDAKDLKNRVVGEETDKKRSSSNRKRSSDGNTKSRHGGDESNKRRGDEGSRSQAHSKNRHASKESEYSSSSSSSHHDGKEAKSMKERSGKMDTEDEKKPASKDEKDVEPSENASNSDISEVKVGENNTEMVSEQDKVAPTLHKPIIAENAHQVKDIIKLRKRFVQQQELSKQKTAENKQHKEEEPKLSKQEFEEGELEDKPAKRQKIVDQAVLPEVEIQAETQGQNEGIKFLEPSGDEGVTPMLPVVASKDLDYTSAESDDDEEIVLELSESDALIAMKFLGMKVDEPTTPEPIIEESPSELPQSMSGTILPKLPSPTPKRCIDGEHDSNENAIPAGATDKLKSPSAGKNKKKRSETKKGRKDATEVGHGSKSPDILNPTSPTENVLLADKKRQRESLIKPSKETAANTTTTKVCGRGKRVSEPKSVSKHQHQQRYESSDLYKPRPTFTPSRRLRESAAAAAAAAAKREQDENLWKK